ncbi:MAG: TIR domain-containing protein [Chloroflexota bacterium]
MNYARMRWISIIIVCLLLAGCLGGTEPNDTATEISETSVAQATNAPATEEPISMTQVALEATATQSSDSVDTVSTAVVVTTDSSSTTNDDATPIPTLSTQEFSTQVADLATAQSMPTPESLGGDDVSAQSLIAGNADVTSFYNTRVNYPNTMRIRMELVFRELRLQPTPLTEDMQEIVNGDIPTPVLVEDDLIQITPPPARDNQRINNIPLYVVAVLDCPANSFDGCNEQSVRRLNLQGINSWAWTIQPLQEQSAQYDLSLRLFASDAVGNITNNTPLYTEDFIVEVQMNAFASLLQNNAGAFVIAISIVVLAVVGLVALRSRQNTVKSIGVSAFISYKRRGSWGIAEKIHDGLTARGVDTFIDSKDLHEGDFEARLTNEIDNRDYVVVILVPETLQSEWVVKEIEYAFVKGKTVIPVLIEGLKMEDLNLPSEIADLRKQNAVSLYQKYFEAGLDEILVFLKPLGK